MESALPITIPANRRIMRAALQNATGVHVLCDVGRGWVRYSKTGERETNASLVTFPRPPTPSPSFALAPFQMGRVAMVAAVTMLMMM